MKQKVFLSIDSEEISSGFWDEIVIEQKLNRHWTCEVQLSSPLEECPSIEIIEGQIITVATNDDDGDRVTLFHGYVSHPQLTYKHAGRYSAGFKAVSLSYGLDRLPEVNYFYQSTARDVVKKLLESSGLKLFGEMPEGARLSYAQWGETDFAFLLGLVDDCECWLRPSVGEDGKPGIEVRSAFTSGPKVVWRKGEYGEWSVRSKNIPVVYGGVHYDSRAMESKVLSGISSKVEHYGDPIGLAAATERLGQAFSATWISDCSRAATLEDFRARLELESRRAKANAQVYTGESRNSLVRAGDEVTIEGLDAVDGRYGVIACTHTWTRFDYRNRFHCTTARRWIQPKRSMRPQVDGSHPARIFANYDPDDLGRVQIQYPWQTEGHTTWVPIVSTVTGERYERLFAPDVGDEVAVRFEEGDPERPVVTGSMWKGIDQLPTDSLREAGGNNEEEFSGNDSKRIVIWSGDAEILVNSREKESTALATQRSNHILMTEFADETGGPVLLLAEGDVIFSAADGRLHTESQDVEVETPKNPYDHRFILNDPVTNEAVAHTNYSIIAPDGRVFPGSTDAMGRTEPIPTGYVPASLHLRLELNTSHPSQRIGKAKGEHS